MLIFLLIFINFFPDGHDYNNTKLVIELEAWHVALLKPKAFHMKYT